MLDRRQKLIEVFRDTQAFYMENKQLTAAIAGSMKGTRFYAVDDYPVLPGKRESPATVSVTKNTSFKAASERYFWHGQERIAVLNFASAVNPGGGVRSGSGAQEESLCRCSTLYPTLLLKSLWEKYYEPNRIAGDPLHTDACIWSPGIIICKSDDPIPRRLEQDEWTKVDVISCAAPNLREHTGNIHNPENAQSIKLTNEEQYEIHLKRAKHILHICAAQRADAVILGAFGCGAFANDPWAVARAYRDALTEYGQYFSYIEFAVYCRDYETANYNAFQATLDAGADLSNKKMDNEIN